jgi:hypothetical protein
MIAVLLGATIGVPYVVSQFSTGTQNNEGNLLAASSSPSLSTTSALSMPTVSPEPALWPAQAPGALINAGQAPLEGSRIHSIEQVLRFDVTKDWVYSNWARKSTGPTDVGLFGVRVPLVTGTHITALAGALTYYFNSQGQVEHISFRGHTGDPRPLADFLARTYQFQRAAAPAGEQLYQVTRSRRVQSELRTRPESVLWTTAPHRSFAVELELARPGSNRFLPPRGPKLDIPQVASSTTPASAPESTAKSNSAESYLDKFRHATPEEEGQVLWRRWPN